MPRLRLLLALSLAFSGPVACLPYAVGSTAQPLPPGERRAAMTAYRIPRGLDLVADSTDDDNEPFAGIDVEMRRGIDERSDVGLRVPSMSGVVATWKRRVAGGDEQGDAALSVMPGAGVVNWLSHGLVELTVMGSGPRRHGITPYAGARVMQTIALDAESVQDTPTAGGYLGLRFGGDRGGLAAELGVYHDKSALGMRNRSTILVPSITVDGDLLDMLRDSGVLDVMRLRRR